MKIQRIDHKRFALLFTFLSFISILAVVCVILNLILVYDERSVAIEQDTEPDEPFMFDGVDTVYDSCLRRLKIEPIEKAKVTNPVGDEDIKSTAENGRQKTNEQSSARRHSGIGDASRLWPKGIVPIVTDEMTSDQKDRWMCAMNFFVEHTSSNSSRERNNIKIICLFRRKASNSSYCVECYSVTGMTGGKQVVSLGGSNARCWEHGTIIHELYHSLGMYHEHARDDREAHITVHFDNIKKLYIENFKKPRDKMFLIGPYDCQSIMHYPPKAYAINSDKPVITPVNASCGQWMGQRNRPTKWDIYKINKLYHCPSCLYAKVDSSIPEPIVRQTHLPKPRNDTNPLGAIMLIGGNPSDKSGITGTNVEIYRPKGPHGQLKEKLLAPVVGHTAEIIKDKMIVVGGSMEDKQKTQIYDLKEKKWKEGPELNEERYLAASAVVNNTFRVCGGIKKKTCEYLDMKTNRWIPFESMHKSREVMAAVSLNGLMYIIGGYNREEGVQNSVTSYDPSTDQWSLAIPPMKYARSNLAATVWNNEIYACGGEAHFSSTNICEKYNLKDNKWVTIGSMVIARNHFQMVTYQDKIYALGGGSTIQTVEVYEKSQDRWYLVEDMALPNYLFAAVVVE